MSNFHEMAPQKNPAVAPEKNFKLSKYKHIIYSFEARDLEISNI